MIAIAVFICVFMAPIYYFIVWFSDQRERKLRELNKRDMNECEPLPPRHLRNGVDV